MLSFQCKFIHGKTVYVFKSRPSQSRYVSGKQGYPFKLKMTKRRSLNYLTTRILFGATLSVIAFTILIVWILGLTENVSVYKNSILSTTILSVVFFFFLTVGLYKGVKLKDDIGDLTQSIKVSKMPDFSMSGNEMDFTDAGEGIWGIILGVIAWLVVTFLIGLFLWLFGAILWAGIIGILAMLYWIFFRSVRRVFKHSHKCKGDLFRSLTYSLFYTFLYNFWIYGIIFGMHYGLK